MATPDTETQETQGRERDASWYDAPLEQAEKDGKSHYSMLPYSVVNRYFLWAVIADRIATNGFDHVLDIGCGTGQFACLLKDKGVQNYLGFDFSIKRIEQAEKACPQFDFVVANALHTDLLEKHNYHTVTCIEFLEHIEDDLGVLRNLKKGTKFFGSVPSFPYASHVRHFRSTNEILGRYKYSFRNLRVDPFMCYMNNQPAAFFILEGKIA